MNAGLDGVTTPLKELVPQNDGFSDRVEENSFETLPTRLCVAASDFDARAVIETQLRLTELMLDAVASGEELVVATRTDGEVLEEKDGGDEVDINIDSEARSEDEDAGEDDGG